MRHFQRCEEVFGFCAKVERIIHTQVKQMLIIVSVSIIPHQSFGCDLIIATIPSLTVDG